MWVLIESIYILQCRLDQTTFLDQCTCTEQKQNIKDPGAGMKITYKKSESRTDLQSAVWPQAVLDISA